MLINHSTLLNQQMHTVLERAECLFDSADVYCMLDQMADQITQQLEHAHPIILCIMTGALVMTGHLLTRLKFLLELDYLHVTRYRGAMQGGELHWLTEPRCSLENRTILITDDIFDGGVTLASIVNFCKAEKAKAVYTAVLINKKRQRERGVHLKPDFIGCYAEEQYLFGFGLDYQGSWRNLPAIYALKS